MSGTVMVEDVGGVRWLRLNRPERRNALTPEMQTELTEVLEAAGQARGVRVVVLAAKGESFCAGLDLSALRGMAGRSAGEYREDSARVAKMFRVLYEMPVPTIAAVNGAAVAGGTGLATICDFTLAVPTAKFGYTEVRIGFVPALVSAYLTMQLGDKRGRQLLLTGRVFDAEEAFVHGLVTEVVPPERLEERAVEIAATLIGNSGQAIRATKRLLAEQNREWLDRAIAAAMAANARARETADFAEGVTAFLEKRRAVWAE